MTILMINLNNTGDRVLQYKLKSGLASYEGKPMGEKEFNFPINKKGVETALKEALEELAELKEIVNLVAHIGIDFGYGKFEIGQDEIDKARLLIEPKSK